MGEIGGSDGPRMAGLVVELPMGTDFRLEPYFAEEHFGGRNITVNTGDTAFMECRVRNVGAKKVCLMLTN